MKDASKPLGAPLSISGFLRFKCGEGVVGVALFGFCCHCCCYVDGVMLLLLLLLLFLLPLSSFSSSFLSHTPCIFSNRLSCLQSCQTANCFGVTSVRESHMWRRRCVRGCVLRLSSEQKQAAAAVDASPQLRSFHCTVYYREIFGSVSLSLSPSLSLSVARSTVWF